MPMASSGVQQFSAWRSNRKLAERQRKRASNHACSSSSDEDWETDRGIIARSDDPQRWVLESRQREGFFLTPINDRDPELGHSSRSARPVSPSRSALHRQAPAPVGVEHEPSRFDVTQMNRTRSTGAAATHRTNLSPHTSEMGGSRRFASPRAREEYFRHTQPWLAGDSSSDENESEVVQQPKAADSGSRGFAARATFKSTSQQR